MTLALCFVHRFVIAVPICNNSAPVCNNSTSCSTGKMAPIYNNNESHSANSFQRRNMCFPSSSDEDLFTWLHLS